MSDFQEFQTTNLSPTGLNEMFRKNLTISHQAMIDAIHTLQVSAGSEIGTIEKEDIIRDIFNDTTGFFNTIDTGNTTAQFSSDHYTASITDGSPASSTEASYNDDNATITTACTCINTGFVSKVVFSHSGTTNQTTTFIKSDYSEMIVAGDSFTVVSQTFNVQIKNASGTVIATKTHSDTGGSNIRKSGKSYTGTDFSMSSTYFPGNHGAAANGEIEFTPVILGVGVVQTNAQFSEGDNITGIFATGRKDDDGTNLITYDVSSDNGSTYTTGLSLNEINTITSTEGNDLIVKFNIPANLDIKLYGYSLQVGRS